MNRPVDDLAYSYNVHYVVMQFDGSWHWQFTTGEQHRDVSPYWEGPYPTQESARQGVADRIRDIFEAMRTAASEGRTR